MVSMTIYVKGNGVFGAVVFLVPLERRDKDTSLAIIKDQIEPRTEIIPIAKSKMNPAENGFMRGTYTWQNICF